MDTKSVHVLYVITKLELGGAQKVCLALWRDVPRDEYSTSLIAGAGGVLDTQVTHASSVTLFQSLHREISWRSVVREMKAFYELVQVMRRAKQVYTTCIVHTHSTKAGLLGRWAAFCARIPLRVHTVHGFAFHRHQNFIKRWLIVAVEFLTSLITTHFVMVSSADVATGKKFFPRFSRKHTVIRAAVAWDQFQAARSALPHKSMKPFLFGTVACFKPQKNLFDFLKAFHAVHQRSSDVRCEIIGDGVQRPLIEAWIAQHKLGSVITLHGWQHDVAFFMARWHVFVLTSLWEGLPCAVVEARLLHLPVLSYATGGIADVIKPQLNGMLYQPFQWSKMAEDMYRLTHDRAWYNLLSVHHDALEQFKETTMVERHKTLYEMLLFESK